jgi:hypothetical protein
VKLWDNLVQEDIKLEIYSMQQKGVEEVAFVGRDKKGRKKRNNKGKKKDLIIGKKDLNKVTCFRCHWMGHYSN